MTKREKQRLLNAVENQYQREKRAQGLNMAGCAVLFWCGVIVAIYYCIKTI